MFITHYIENSNFFRIKYRRRRTSICYLGSGYFKLTLTADNKKKNIIEYELVNVTTITDMYIFGATFEINFKKCLQNSKFTETVLILHRVEKFWLQPKMS